jgi:hypothetical protein
MGAGLDRPVSQEDVEISLAVARDLGPGSEVAVVSEFLERVGPAIDARVDARLAEARRGRRARSGQPALAFVSLGVGIPITAISLAIPDGASSLVAAAIAWAGLVGVNLAAGFRRT